MRMPISSRSRLQTVGYLCKTRLTNDLHLSQSTSSSLSLSDSYLSSTGFDRETDEKMRSNVDFSLSLSLSAHS